MKLDSGMMLGNKVTVFSGTGYIGREIVNAMSKAGYEITVCARRPERYRDFALFANTKVAMLASYDDAEQLDAVLDGADIVVNLTADRLNGTEMVALDDLVHVNQKIKSAMEHTGVKRVLSLSQIGASSNQEENDYLCKLGEADALMHTTASADVTIFKASLLIGENDDTTQRYVNQLNRFGLLMVAQGETVVQPVWVRDFAAAFVASVKNSATFGQKLDVAGEERLTLKELGELVSDLMQKDAVVFPMCRMNAKIMSMMGAFAPVASVSKAQLLMLEQDMVSDEDFSTQFGFVPASLEWVVSNYAVPHNIRDRYNFFRKEAKRNADELV
ncbi:NAD(P)H-binding protein [Thiomicrorhabdus sp. ZW0627]|uniref:NAD(P)H-binding protein n=1 Tax=Thiomicrorhabdus sp. ZW0627 TaxID=3039774 RepID=UPI002436AB48|nr:NAD(P)H-binding protein [Thiomicrorhabdus sp. ZW0627]MDG6774442.1 NAD(P)H-binding protein [Thiomicrorhabdus sp. ZW0627]